MYLADLFSRLLAAAAAERLPSPVPLLINLLYYINSERKKEIILLLLLAPHTSITPASKRE